MTTRMKFIEYDARPEPKTSRYCVMCQRDLKPGKPHRFVYVAATYQAVHPDDLEKRSPLQSDDGWQRIGLDCAEKLGLEWTIDEPLVEWDAEQAPANHQPEENNST